MHAWAFFAPAALAASLLLGCGSDSDAGSTLGSGGGSKGGSGGSGGSGSSSGSSGGGGMAGAAGGSGGGSCVDDPKAQPPTVEIAPVKPLVLPHDRADLLATATSPNGSIIAYAWKQTAGPVGAKLHYAESSAAHVAGLEQGSYTFTVTVRDEKCREATASIDVEVGAAPPLPSTPIEQIRYLAEPAFKKGHTLPPLTYASCTWSNPNEVAFETELVEKYGYAYSLHRATAYWNGLLKNPGSDVAQKVAKNKANPSRYKLFTSVMRPLWVWEEGRSTPYDTYLTVELPKRCPGCSPSLLTADSKLPQSVTFSPAADPKYYDLVGDDTAVELMPYKQQNIPLSVVLNLAEDGVGLSQGDCHGHHWETDPAIVADLKSVLKVSSVPPCGTEAWARYASNRIARTNQRITDKVLAALPPGALYVRYRVEGNLNRGRYASWYDYAPFYEDTKNNSALPSMSAYYAGDEPPYLHWDDSAWDPNTDMLTGTLASVAWQIKEGSPLSYNWVSGGWPTATHKEVSTIDRYTGYLKALYLAGNIGAVASWWSPGLWQAASGWSCNPDSVLAEPNKIPDGIGQMVALGEVHALFSHFEDFLRNGTLVPGPGVHRFTVKSPASEQVPAYELNCDPTTKLCDQKLRVLARKHASKSEWLVVAFAASGNDQDVTVTLPGAGSISVRCRAGGSLYHVVATAGAPTVTLIDEDPLRPTKFLAP
jgi:hypothetical protein